MNTSQRRVSTIKLRLQANSGACLTRPATPLENLRSSESTNVRPKHVLIAPRESMDQERHGHLIPMTTKTLEVLGQKRAWYPSSGEGCQSSGFDRFHGLAQRQVGTPQGCAAPSLLTIDMATARHGAMAREWTLIRSDHQGCAHKTRYARRLAPYLHRGEYDAWHTRNQAIPDK